MKASWIVLTCLLCGHLSVAGAVEVVEEYVVYSNGPAAGIELQVWGMRHREHEGRIYLNEDWQARPAPRVRFRLREEGGAMVTLTPDWINHGYVRFRVNGLADRYGNAGSPCTLSIKLVGVGNDNDQQDPGPPIQPRFYEGGDGIDASIETWQGVLVPIKLLSGRPGTRITGVTLGTRWSTPTRAFAVDQVSLVRFSGVREETQAAADQNVTQPWVTWPSYEALPEALKVDKNPLLYQDGKFMTGDGRRAFLISAWGHEDQRFELGINHQTGEVVPHWNLYDPVSQGFIYEQPLDDKSLSRLGFNCFANQVIPGPFYKALGCATTNQWGRDMGTPEMEQEFLDHVRRIGGPFYVDMVCFPWDLGWPGDKANKNMSLSPEVLHNGWHHWMPYRIIGQGREVWLTLWRTYAQRYKDAGARVVFYEFLNEPFYRSASTPDHLAEFVEWLKRRYGTLEHVNTVWGAKYASWDAIGDLDFKGERKQPGVFFDYDEYLGDRLTDLIVAGREAIEAITPGVPAAVQALGRHDLYPGDAVFLAKLIPVERAVLTPTGGGTWSESVSNDVPKPSTLDYGMSGSPIGNDLLLAMAGDKMIVDNEMYRHGPKLTRADMRNRWWRAVLCGLDGASWFSWNKRGNTWEQGRERILKEADQFRYSGLIPFANRADLLRGHLDFAEEMERVREYVLPKPWGPEAKIGFLYSWANARQRKWDPQLRDKSGYYHAAMKYLHWNLDAIPSHMASPAALARHHLLVAGGMDYAEPELVKLLNEYVAGGGCLVIGEGTLDRDLYGKPIATETLLGVRVKGVVDAPGVLKNLEGPDFPLLPGEVVSNAGARGVELLQGTKTVWTDSSGRPMVTRHALGNGEVYYIAADLIGYPLAKLIGSIAESTGVKEPLEITDDVTGQLAPNILVSRRSYASHHALLLNNTDGFPKLVRIRIEGLEGNWHVSDPLEGVKLANGSNSGTWTGADLAQEGIPYWVKGGDRGLVLLTRTPWAKTPLTTVRDADVKGRFDAELARWTQTRKGAAQDPFSMDPSRAHYVDLKAAANATTATVVQDARTRYQGFPHTEMTAQDVGGVPFEVIRWDHNEGRGFVAVRSAATPQHPQAVKGIRLGSRAARVFFLHTCGEGKDGERLGQYVLRYADGTSAEVPLVVGATIGRLTDRLDRKGELATVLVTAFGSAWHVLEWENPKPEVALESLDVVAAPEASGTVVLVAITLAL